MRLIAGDTRRAASGVNLKRLRKSWLFAFGGHPASKNRRERALRRFWFMGSILHRRGFEPLSAC